MNREWIFVVTCLTLFGLILATNWWLLQHYRNGSTMQTWYKAWETAFACKGGEVGQLVEFRAQQGGKVEAYFRCPEGKKL